jgi:hypothetical protein
MTFKKPTEQHPFLSRGYNDFILKAEPNRTVITPILECKLSNFSLQMSYLF